MIKEGNILFFMDLNYKIPHKTLVPERLVTMSLKLPRTNTQKKLSQSPINFVRDQMSKTQTKLGLFDKFQGLESLNQGLWMIPQKMDKGSPEGKKLKIMIDKLKGDSKLAKMRKINSPDVIFSKQPQRLPLPQPTFHEEKMSVSPVRPISGKKIKKKFVLIKENIVREIEIVSRQSSRKQASKLLYLKHSLRHW